MCIRDSSHIDVQSLQEKVDSYMQPDKSGKPNKPDKTTSESSPQEGAPLLPNDKLPQSLADKTANQPTPEANPEPKPEPKEAPAQITTNCLLYTSPSPRD